MRKIFITLPVKTFSRSAFESFTEGLNSTLGTLVNFNLRGVRFHDFKKEMQSDLSYLNRGRNTFLGGTIPAKG